MVPCIWLPVALTCLGAAIRSLPLATLLATALAGAALWQLAEYAIHRFVFHREPIAYWGVTVHFLLHGCHHKYPTDALRLVFPPAVGALVAMVVYCTLRLCLTRVRWWMVVVIAHRLKTVWSESTDRYRAHRHWHLGCWVVGWQRTWCTIASTLPCTMGRWQEGTWCACVPSTCITTIASPAVGLAFRPTRWIGCSKPWWTHETLSRTRKPDAGLLWNYLCKRRKILYMHACKQQHCFFRVDTSCLFCYTPHTEGVVLVTKDDVHSS